MYCCVFSQGLSELEFEKNPPRMFELRCGAQFSVFLRFERQLVETQQQALCCVSIFISKESATSESYYCAYFEALLHKHTEQTDEVHFTVRLLCYTEVTWSEEKKLKSHVQRSHHLSFILQQTLRRLLKAHTCTVTHCCTDTSGNYNWGQWGLSVWTLLSVLVLFTVTYRF